VRSLSLARSLSLSRSRSLSLAPSHPPFLLPFTPPPPSVAACLPGGPRRRDETLLALGEPVVRAVPGYTLSTDMRDAVLFVDPGSGGGGRKVVNVTAADGTVLQLGAPTLIRNSGGSGSSSGAGGDGVAGTSTAGSVSIAVKGLSRGRSRVAIGFRCRRYTVRCTFLYAH
jgi:hypothetical protein